MKADGRHLTRKNTKGDAIKVSYDDLGKVSEYDFGDGAVYRANFNSHGKLTEVIYPDLSTEKYEYDGNSTLSKSITRNGDIKKYYFDNSGNLIRKEVGKSEKTFSYDEEGRMVSATNEVGTILFGYTSSGIPNYVQYPNNVSLQYTYDLKGRRSSLSYNGKYNISYRYDEVFGRLSEVFQNSDKMLMQVTYDRYGRVSRRTLGNGMYTIFEYDSLAVNLLKLTNYNSNDTVSSRFEYSYDSRGRRISMNTTDGVWYYGYDSLSQLSFIKDPWGNVTRYTYDSRGNRLMAAKNNKRSYYSVNSLNQYISHGDQTFSYDKNGNLINKYDPARATQVFEYDADNRLVSTKQGQKGCNYVYNALGNLFQKTCKDGTSTSFIVDPFGIWGGDVVGKVCITTFIKTKS